MAEKTVKDLREERLNQIRETIANEQNKIAANTPGERSQMRAEMAKESRSSNIRNALLSGLATALLFMLGGPLLGCLGLGLTAFFGGKAVVDHLDARRYEYGTDQQRQSRANAAQNLQTYEEKERELQNDMQNEYAAMIEKAKKAQNQEPVRERVNIQEMRGEENHHEVNRVAARQDPVPQMQGGMMQ